MGQASEKIVNRFFAAMQAGAASEAEMMELFHDDAIYTEPFTGTIRTHVGKEAIRATMREGWKYPLPDMRIEVDQLEIERSEVRARWTCYSPGLPGGKGQGENRFTLVDGLIIRLDTSVAMPQ